MHTWMCEHSDLSNRSLRKIHRQTISQLMLQLCETSPHTNFFIKQGSLELIQWDPLRLSNFTCLAYRLRIQHQEAQAVHISRVETKIVAFTNCNDRIKVRSNPCLFKNFSFDCFWDVQSSPESTKPPGTFQKSFQPAVTPLRSSPELQEFLGPLLHLDE